MNNTEDQNQDYNMLINNYDYIRTFPGAAVRKIGYVATTREIMNAYCWRIDSSTLSSTEHIEDDTDEFKLQLIRLLFPTPYDANLDCEIRALIAKVVVADGLWSDFIIGASFADYLKEDNSQIYADNEARDLGVMFEHALKSIGRLKLTNMYLELLEVLLLPG